MGCNVIKGRQTDYYIFVDGQQVDSRIAEFLKITDEEYQSKLVEYGGYISSYQETYFKNREDAKKALDEYVLPLYIIIKLSAVG